MKTFCSILICSAIFLALLERPSQAATVQKQVAKNSVPISNFASVSKLTCNISTFKTPSGEKEEIPEIPEDPDEDGPYGGAVPIIIIGDGNGASNLKSHLVSLLIAWGILQTLSALVSQR